MEFYYRKNKKYNDSFNQLHQTYAEAHYNIRRKFARLDNIAFREGRDKLSAKLRRDLYLELADMAIYSMMSIMKFYPQASGAAYLKKLGRV